MDLRLLKYFLMTAQEQNISRAAQLLHITQPTLSKELKKLEESLGTKLFVRTNKSVFLTEDGLYLRKKAIEIITLSDKLESEFKNGLESYHGDIVIGSGETRSFITIADCIRKLNLQYPDICFHIFSGDGDSLFDRIAKGLVDFAILMDAPDISQYEYLKLPVRAHWGFYIHEDSPLAQKEYISPSDIMDVPLIMPERHGLRRIITEWAGVGYEELNIVAKYNLIYNISFFIENGMAYALGLDGLMNISEFSHIRFLPLLPDMNEQYYIVWKRDQPMNKLAKVFLKQLRQVTDENES